MSCTTDTYIVFNVSFMQDFDMHVVNYAYSLHQATEAALKAGHHVVVDNTNPGKKERKQYVDLAKKHSEWETL